MKNWKTFREQLELLKSRGLRVENEKRALDYLERIGYYRLSGYAYPLRQKDTNNPAHYSDTFPPEVRFEHILQLYIFDKKLRLLTLDALERIEVALRVDVSYSLGAQDPLAHHDPKYFDPKFDHAGWFEQYEKLLERAAKANSAIVKHHQHKYGGALPIWAASEIWDFGALANLYRGMKPLVQEKIARKYGIKSGKHLGNYLHGFNFIRNIAAHHSRLWNRNMIGRPTLKGLADSEWKHLSEDKIFPSFCLMQLMLKKICPNSQWGNRFKKLLQEFPPIDSRIISLQDFGLTIDIENWSLWTDKKEPPALNS